MLGLFNEIANWNLFKSEEEKEKERLAKIYTNPVTGEVEQYASGLMGMRPEVQRQIDRRIAEQQAKPIVGQIGPDGQPISFFDALTGVRPMDITKGPMDITQGTVPAPDPNQIKPSKEVAEYITALGKGDSKAVTEAAKGISPNTLITLLSAFQQDKPKAPTITTTPTAARGLMFDDEDPYERYRRQGGMF
jgi:hypothetical protein